MTCVCVCEASFGLVTWWPVFDPDMIFPVDLAVSFKLQTKLATVHEGGQCICCLICWTHEYTRTKESGFGRISLSTFGSVWDIYVYAGVPTDRFFHILNPMCPRTDVSTHSARCAYGPTCPRSAHWLMCPRTPFHVPTDRCVHVPIIGRARTGLGLDYIVGWGLKLG